MKHGDEMVEAYVDEAEDEQLENDEQEQRNMVRYRKVSQKAVKLPIQSEHIHALITQASRPADVQISSP